MVSAKSFAKAMSDGLIAFVAVPIYLACMAIFMSLLTVTVIGPFAPYVCTKSDDKLLAKSLVTYILVHEMVRSRRLAIRWSEGVSSLLPVCIPNGLGAMHISI